jgi:hypothetical protein
VNKTDRYTEFQFYWYYHSTRFGQPFCPSSGALSRTSAWVHFMQLWWPYAIRSRIELHGVPPTPDRIRLSQQHKMYQIHYTAKNSLWWTERLPETCRIVIPIKLEFSASVGFIHKEFVTIHGHMILKFPTHILYLLPWFGCLSYPQQLSRRYVVSRYKSENK